ncbi:protein FAM234B isoform X3 [Ahaetulla prasina]|uniref:protein FAM234B isoform X3 n=1 Tax=Ahaetulla prasina TaxID=499056 RepID=UPI002648BA3B|nr:protein FAM234B isoform X3 [Ahaetulla prasina]
MATVLSRALKLPGKKSPDLGEYDPLTQADSDESEDDLVLNLQKNGGVKNGKSPLGEVQDVDSDMETSIAKQHLSEGMTEEYPSEMNNGLEQKTASSLMPYLRTAIFLLTVVISMILVLVCAFLIPCPPRDLHNTWIHNLGQVADGILFPPELFDVNNDGLPDVLLSFTALKNASVLGKSVWTFDSSHFSNGILAAPAVIIPDVDGDRISDLMVLTLGKTQPELSFILISGKTGSPVGGPVKYSINRRGKLIDPQIYITCHGAVYILFGFGRVYAVALRDIFAQARNHDNFPPVLQHEEPEWEKHRSIDLLEFIDIYSGGVVFLQAVKSSDSNCSDLLITTEHGLTLLRGQDLEQRWTLEQPNIDSQPCPGYFNEDQTLDFMLQAQHGNVSRKILVVDGKSGLPVWNYELPYHMRKSDALSVLTLDKKSVFLFWANEKQSFFKSLEPRPRIHHLYLLHPTFPSVLLDLSNTTDPVIASSIGINDLQKDAFYITVTRSPTSEHQPGVLSVRKLRLRWALMTQSRDVPLKDTNAKINHGELRRILSRIKFIDFAQKF